MSVAEKYGIDLTLDHKTGCPGCLRKGNDHSRNNLQVYGGTESAHCFACGWTIASKEHRESMGWDDNEEDFEEDEVSTKDKITPEENERIKKATGSKSKDWRGIKDNTNIAYGVRYEYDPSTNEPVKQFVPTTIDNELVGYKTRVFPKDFGNPIGLTGKDCQLIGQFRYKSGGKTLLIVGGEVDMLSAEQMLRESQEARGYGDYESFAVVAPSIGESGADRQVQAQYEFCSKWDKVIIGMDSDDAGKKAAEKIAKVLPRGKVFICDWSLKDPNEFLVKGKAKQFVNEVWKAKPYTPAGVVAAGTIYDEIVERSKVDKLPFPPFLNKLNKMLAGGINYGYIVNILAGSGVGKSALINSCITYFMTTCNKRVLVCSLEAEASEFGENLLSSVMQRKIAMIEDREEKIAFVSSDAAKEAANNLFMFPDGTPRLYLLDDRGDFSQLQAKIEECITMHDVDICVIDVISDVFSGASLEEVDKWMKWEKNLVKSTNCILIQVAHTKKPAGSAKAASVGGTVSEEMLIGSGTQFRSAGINIALQRDKSHADPIMRNTTEVFLLKSRATGITGKALELYYDNATATLWDKEDWVEANGPSVI